MSRNSIQIDDYVANPRRFFSGPFEVADSMDLKCRDKIRILESWKLDAERLSDSDAENMTGGEESNLRDVAKALLQVKAYDASLKASSSRGKSQRRSGTGTAAQNQTTMAVGVGAAVGAGAGAVLAAAAALPMAVTLVQATLVGAIGGGICSVFLRSSRR